MSREGISDRDMVDNLPWVCPQHPQAQIRRSWDQTHYVMNGYPAGTGTKSNFKYECAECGLELSPEPPK